jgi:ubiquinone/menaquinone biosynthesis C-methylase UbiE
MAMDIDLDTYREHSLDTWEEMAPGWEERNEWMAEVAGLINEWVLERADPQPGHTVLDVAAGPGDLGHQAAARVGPEGRTLSTDFSPEMVEVARRLGAAQGLENVEYRVLDAERMHLEDESVDAVVCRWGYMLMADPAAALTETRRVLRGGGALSFAVWASPERNPWAAVPAMTLVQRGHMPPPEPSAPGIFAMADPERIRSLVTEAGFDELELEEVRFDFRYADFDDFWDVLVSLAGPLARALKALPEDERQATREAIEESISSFREEDGSYAMSAVCWGAVAR